MLDSADDDVLTARRMLSLPRPSAAIVSPSGLRFAQVASNFDFRSRRTTKHVYVTEISADDAGTSRIVIQDIRFSELVWLDDTTLLYISKATGKEDSSTCQTDKQRKELFSRNSNEDVQFVARDIDSLQDHVVGSIPLDAISDLKCHHISSEEVVLAFVAAVYGPDHLPFNSRREAEKIQEELEGSNVRVYDELFIRHWDTWMDKSIKQPQVIFISRSSSFAPLASPSLESIHSLSSEDETDFNKPSSHNWAFSGEILSPLAQTNLECPVGTLGGSDDFDLNAHYLTFKAKDPNLPPAWHTRQPVYIVPLFPRNAEESHPKCLTGAIGESACPTLSPTFKHAGQSNKGSVAWLEMRQDGYEADRLRVMVHDFASGDTKGFTESWDRSPGSISWSQDGKSLYLTAEDQGYVRLFRLDLKDGARPERVKVLERGSVIAVSVLPTPVIQQHFAPPETPEATRLIITHNSMTHPNKVSVWHQDKEKLELLSNLSGKALSSISQSLDKGEEFWFKGAFEGQDVHGWIMRPPNFPKKRDVATLAAEERKWPLAFLIHGGPQGSWTDSWSTRWNPSVWASQGYVTVMIDPTGSTGYGQRFTDSIQGQWGGLPYEDLVAGYKYCLDTFSEIDPDRTIAAGASYGGYMINWLQGHNPGFKALVCHDGVFNCASVWYSTEELWFPEHENLDTTPYNGSQNYEKWNPVNHIKNWSTPQLIIHGGRDYRLPETEGIGVFNTLQRLGIPSRLVYFETENHWVLDPLNSAQWHKEVFRFAGEWVKPGRQDKVQPGYRVTYIKAAV